MFSPYRLFLALLLVNLAPAAEVVRLCNVLSDPGKYKNTELVVTAGFRVGFEWQALVCFDCDITRNKRYDVWVNFTRNVKGTSKLPKVKAFDQLERVTFQGTFEGPGTYGHLGGYKYQFNVNEVKAAERVWKLTPKQNDAPEAIKASVCN